MTFISVTKKNKDKMAKIYNIKNALVSNINFFKCIFPKQSILTRLYHGVVLTTAE